MANPLRSIDTVVRPLAPSDPAERRAFWIERGNQILDEMGRRDLQWGCVNGSYFIEPRR